MSEVTIDKVLVSILQKRFKSIVEEMSIAITMTASRSWGAANERWLV